MNRQDGGDGPGLGARIGPAWRATRKALGRAARLIAREVRDYDVPGRVRALEIDRRAGIAGKRAARMARAGGVKAGRSALGASRFAARQTARAAREAGPLAKRLRAQSGAGVEALRMRRLARVRQAPEPVVAPVIAPAPALPVRHRVEEYHEPGLGERIGGKGKMVMAGIAGMVIGSVGVVALAGSVPKAIDPERAKIEAIVRDYILEHPEILPEAMQRLQGRETARAVASNRRAIETPFAGAWAGAEDGDVVLVEFFDYACGYCRQSVADVERLLREDKQLKVVFREFPVLGPESEEAAKVSLSAARQGNFMAFHRAMYAAGRPSRISIGQAQGKAGLDAAKVSGDRAAAAVTAELDQNIALARTLGLTGTPSFVVGDRVLSGAVGYDKIKQAIAEARKKG